VLLQIRSWALSPGGETVIRGPCRNLIEAPLSELELDITSRLGWVRDPRLLKPEPLYEKITSDIVGALESYKVRLLIFGRRERPSE
jgi:hypothetical protein